MQKIIDDNVIKNDVFQQKNERIMARKRRIWFPGAVYHLMHRGVRRTAIFEDEMDYQVMLKLLKVSLEMNITVRQSRQSGVARATCPD